VWRAARAPSPRHRHRGGAGNAIVIVERARFHWLTGEDHRVTYALHPTTLDDPIGVGIKAHIFCASRADWDFDMEGAPHHAERST
jgi:hypothetical protein